jgi:hypothetical protein
MRLKISVLSVFSLFFASSAFGAAALPVVNVSRSVSARAMYGEAPKGAEIKVQSSDNVARASIPTTNYQLPITNSQLPTSDILTPRRPSGDLWARTSDAPLRMPRADEFAKLSQEFTLPEESLDTKISEMIASAKSSKPVQKVAARKIEPLIASPQPRAPSPDKDELAKAYEAGRIAELQRIADRALADGGKKESKTRKLVVPMEDVSKPAVASVRSAKALPMTEDEFAYKDELPLTKLSPLELKRAFKKTYVSENKHLSTFRVDDGFDAPSDVDVSVAVQGFDSSRDLSESGDIRPLEIKVSFAGNNSALSRDNYMLLSEYAGIVVSNPRRAVQVSIPEHAARSYDGRKLAARRLAIIEQVLRDTGVPDAKIVPVLADRDDDALVLRMISNDVFQSLTQNRGKKTTTTKSLSW